MQKKILYALLSAVIAIGLWVYVVTVVSPESTETFSNISVTLDGEKILRDRGLMIVTEKMQTVTLKLSGNRSDLRKLSSSNITITVDVSRITEAGEPDLPYTISYPGDVPSGSIQVMSKSPERISLKVVEADRITVPIEIKSPNKVNAPYWVDSGKITANYESVTVEGPASVIAQIKSAAVTVDVSGKTQTIKEDFDVVLYDEDGNVVEDQWLTLSAPQINVTVPIYLTKEVPLVLPNLLHNGGTTEQNTKLEGLPETIKVYGNEQVISKLQQISIPEKIDLSNYENGQTLTIDISSALGMGVYLDENQSSTISVTIRIDGLGTTLVFVPASSVQFRTPDGYQASLTEKTIGVYLRGPSAKIKNLRAENFTVIVDATNMNSDNDKVKYTVQMNDDFADCGAIGPCLVSVQLKPLG